LLLCVVHGGPDVEGGPGGDAVVEVTFAEYLAETFHDGGEVEDPSDVAVAAGRAVERGGDVGLFEAVEQHGQVGERDGDVAYVAASLE
jgi:hypothetical protein